MPYGQYPPARQGGGLTAAVLMVLIILIHETQPAISGPGQAPGRGQGRHARPAPDQPHPSRSARADIPPRYLAIYRSAHTARQCPGLSWTVLAGIGKVESDHGRSSAPGVRSGVNRFGCCAGPMQFNLTNGPPSTWARYRRRGDSVYDPADAIPAAARLLCSAGAPKRMRKSLLAYNASTPYVRTVLAWAARYRGGGR